MKGNSLAGLKALVIEDEPIVALELTTHLEDWGIEVTAVAHNRDDARGLLQTLDIDVALVDLQLGTTFAGFELGRIAASRDIEVVFVTGHPGLVTQDLLATIPNSQVVGKPFMPERIKAALIKSSERHLVRAAG